MSDESFDYLFLKSEVLDGLAEQIEEMSGYLKSLHLPDAGLAGACLDMFVVMLRGANRTWRDLAELMRQIEWCASADTAPADLAKFLHDWRLGQRP